VTNPAHQTMSATQDAARHVDSDAEIVAKHAKAEVGMIGDDFFDILGSVSPKGFRAAESKDYRVEFVGKEGSQPCTRFVLDN